MVAVHLGLSPRVRGTFHHHRRRRQLGGLSPRVRGNPGARHGGAGAVGSIPACAGEPSGGICAVVICAVYPRVCGGTAAIVIGLGAAAGLSPRVRGNLVDSPFSSRWPRSIPACAGEPSEAPTATAGGWVYPRVCGGTPTFGSARDSQRGLSPRVRGNPPAPAPLSPAARSIPACAGEPRRQCQVVRVGAVYPRVCGGTTTTIPTPNRRRGLSPRVRGNPCCNPTHPQGGRSIPACAGEPAAARCMAN